MKLRNFLWLLFLAALCGPSFLFIKVAVAEIPPLTLVLWRVGLAAAVLYIVLRTQGRNLPQFGRVWQHFAFMALVHNAIPFILFGWGEQYIDSALAAILNGTTPLFTLVLAHLFTTDDRMTPTKTVGTFIGFAGLLLLIAPSLLGGVQATTWGLIAIAVAAACYAVAIIYSRRNLRGLPPLVAPTAQAPRFATPQSCMTQRPKPGRLPITSTHPVPGTQRRCFQTPRCWSQGAGTIPPVSSGASNCTTRTHQSPSQELPALRRQVRHFSSSAKTSTSAR